MDCIVALATRMVEALCWFPSQIQAVCWGAYLHDIGEVAIPDAALLKPGALTVDEQAVMCSHIERGMTLVAALDFWPDMTLAVVRDHHERWDGQGYSEGKVGREISLAGRIFTLCDV
ncbi:HD-GYP domain-containing protein (c-di-GMP phosphodiesterase class II) [Deinococcus humi]|uniref:HD-GYP domain-containing protein (C-di-GMP phosphodiesterase class II) n=2 Tax=Deinococcus humi TaxID=662880 RepID=A0A7W8NJJ6_9DEIO|nr:HD domain-containing phosphohydrolase [Deinococcus humi]MBB5366182.1 HD-GYP domain-containing protein (c-di-GMP phosphodiesterase class II) [Deinococcus humi]GGO40774.1 hypothetical protein GCM10008949_50620 [Deinococcus humi]